MNFKEFLTINGFIYESKYLINNTTVFKTPSKIKGEYHQNTTTDNNFFRNQGKDSSRSQYRRIPINKRMIPNINEILECIKYYCDYELKNQGSPIIIIDRRKKNKKTFEYLGLDIDNKTDINKVIKYILLALKPNDFNADYGDETSWFFEFVIRKFCYKKYISEHFKINKDIIEQKGNNLLIKITVKSLNNEKGIIPSSDNYIYINSKNMCLFDISFHFIHHNN